MSNHGRGDETVGIDPMNGVVDDFQTAWRHVGELLAHGQSRIDARLGRMERDVAVLKTDVAELKGDVAELKGTVARMEVANEKRSNRMDAQFERLVVLIQRDELGK